MGVSHINVPSCVGAGSVRGGLDFGWKSFSAGTRKFSSAARGGIVLGEKSLNASRRFFSSGSAGGIVSGETSLDTGPSAGGGGSSSALGGLVLGSTSENAYSTTGVFSPGGVSSIGIQLANTSYVISQAQPFSFSWWWNSGGSGSSFEFTFGQLSSFAGEPCWYANSVGQGQQFGLYTINPVNTTYFSPTFANVPGWYFYTITMALNAIRLYQGGSLVSTLIYTSPPFNPATSLGTYIQIYGQIFDIRFYNQRLSGPRIANIGTGAPDSVGLVNWWKCDEGTFLGQTCSLITDYVGGNHLTSYMGNTLQYSTGRPY